MCGGTCNLQGDPGMVFDPGGVHADQCRQLDGHGRLQLPGKSGPSAVCACARIACRWCCLWARMQWRRMLSPLPLYREVQVVRRFHL